MRRYRQPLSGDERRGLLERLTEVEGFEHYLKRAFLGQKQFSIEGLDVMVPMLDEAVGLGVEAGAHEVVIGLAHRGRLIVLAHIIGRPDAWFLQPYWPPKPDLTATKALIFSTGCSAVSF